MKRIFVNNVYIFINIILLIVGGVSAEKSWASRALETQRVLSSSLPIDKAPLFTYSSSTYGSLFRNQNLSLSAQFDLGVRYIELDLHYIPELNETSKGPYRICHASSGVYLFCENVAGWEACNESGVLNYGPDTGCTPATPNYTDIFSEISDWLTANSHNVIVVNLDDSISESDIEDAGDMQSQVNGWLEQYFGRSIYTPLDFKRDGGWPTVQSLANMGKRIIFNTNNHTFNGTYIFPDLRGFVWPASKIKYFSGYPSLSTAGSSVSFGFFQEDGLILNFHGVLLYNGSEEVGSFDASSSLGVMQCQFSTCYDFISEESAQQLVWSWDFNQPNQGKYNSCGSVNLQTGRWQAEDCSNKHYFACKSKTQDIWTLGDVSSTRLEYYDLSTVCPPGYTFSSPRTAQENSWMQLFINSQLGNNNNNNNNNNSDNNVWISMSRTGGWWSEYPLNGTDSNSSRATMVQSNFVYLFAAILVMFVIY